MKKKLLKTILLYLKVSQLKLFGYLPLLGLFALLIFNSCERSEQFENELTTNDIKDGSLLKNDDGRSDEFYENFELNAKILLGPEKLVIENGNSNFYTFQIDNKVFNQFEEPFVLYLKNGSDDFGTRVNGAKVIIDGNVIISPRGFTQAIESSRQEIQLNQNSQIMVFIEGELNSFCELTIKGIPNSKTITDYDGNVYKTVKIGNQVWMAENLKTTHFSNGTPIQMVESIADWAALAYEDKAYCYYNNDLSNFDTYGALYTWPAAMNGEASSASNPSGVQGICPTGWHLPSVDEWQELGDYLGGFDIAGGEMKEVGTEHWLSPNTGATNSSGFTGLPAGWRLYSGYFTSLKYIDFWWTATELDATYVHRRSIDYNSTRIGNSLHTKDCGFSVRCVKD